jgi:MoaA/NifB/PqqE/SkfB family radical SAM enzyme
MPGRAEMVRPTGEHGVIQFHPTRRCNLRCLHCYSSSGPEVRAELAESVLHDALEDAAREGYAIAGFSGGEPLLYRALPAVLEHARALGLTVTVTSNGTTLTRRAVASIAPHTCLLAISLDGTPESHDRMRASPTAFSRLAARLDGVRESGIPFGFIFTLTQHNVNELDWVASFAAEHGASLLQIHPLDEVGRASSELRGHSPDGIEATFAALELVRLRERYAGTMRIHLDIADTTALADRVRSVPAGDAPLAAFVSPLVVETDGRVTPLQYGFDARFELGNLHDARLTELGAAWRHERLPAFTALCADVERELSRPGGERFVDWYAAVADRAAATAAV